MLELAAHRFDRDLPDAGPQYGLAEDMHDLAAAFIQDGLPADLRCDERPDGLRRDAVLGEELLAVRHLPHESCGLKQAGYERGLVLGEQPRARGLQGPELVLERRGAPRATDPVFPYSVLSGRLPAKSEQRSGFSADRRGPCPDLLLGRKLQAVLDPGDLRLPPALPEHPGELEAGNAGLLAESPKPRPESAKGWASGCFSQCLSRSGQDARRAGIRR